MRKTILVLSIGLAMLAGTLFPFENDGLPLGDSKYKHLLMHLEADKMAATASKQEVTVEDIVAANPKTRVFMVGEYHDSYLCHTLQRDFIEALVKKNKKIVVGFEFFKRKDNEVLDQYRLGKIEEKELLEKTGWYAANGLNFGYTRLVMDVIRKHNIKVVGLNVPRKIVHKVSTMGFDRLPPEDKALFPTINIPNRDHEYFIRSQFGDFSVQMDGWFQNMYMAQKCWDVIMAESMRRELARKENRGHVGVIIAGSAHIDYKLGIPFRYKAADNRSGITTIVPVYLPEKDDEDEDGEEHPMLKMMAKSLKPAAVFSRGLADYVFTVTREITPYFPVFGVSGKIKDDLFVVSRVKKDSLADLKGIEKGDVILSIDGITIKSVEQLRTIFAAKTWDQELKMEIRKTVKIVKE